jgi:hypothetical protein
MDKYNLVTNNQKKLDCWSQTISEPTQKNPTLSYRSKREVKQRIINGEVWVASNNDNYIASIFATELTKNITEIHGAYTKSAYRGQGIFSGLLDMYADKNPNKELLAVVIKNRFRDYLVNNKQFREIDISSLSMNTKLQIITNRLFLFRLWDVCQNIIKEKPHYLLR